MNFRKMCDRLRLLFKLAVHNRGDGMREKYSSSQLLAGFGTVMPKNKPEDFRMLQNVAILRDQYLLF